MNRITSLGVSLVAILVVAPDVAAQACVGIPSGSRGAIGGTTLFHDQAKSYGVSGMTTSGSNLYVVGEAGITTYESDFLENETTLTAMAAQEIEALEGTASVCPYVGVGYSFGEALGEGYGLLAIPVGVGIGKTLPLGDGGNATLTPHISPQFFWARATADSADEPESDTFFGVTAGGTVGIGQVVAGFTVSKVFEEGSDAILGLQAGFAF